MTLFHFEYDLDIALRCDQYDFGLERSKYSTLNLSPSFELFLRKVFAVYSFNKYILSFENTRKIFEPLHSGFKSFVGTRTDDGIWTRVLRGNEYGGNRLVVVLAISGKS